MDNTISATLKDVVDKHEGFLENPLDVYDSYTYTLEWFVCDRKTTREFQEQEAFNMETIVSDGWPRLTDNAITIAKTGVTTEFTVADLTVEAVGVGNGDYSKIAGTADKLSFTVTQVGNTSLANSLQTVVALCGFSSITDAEYFIKINFVGHGTHAKKKKLSQTKVIPFKIVNYQNLNTTTDARGTTTVISGQVPADKVVMDTDVAKTQHGFSYKIANNLEASLTNFFAKLNKSIEDNDKALLKSMKHTYGYQFSDRVRTLGWNNSGMPSEHSLNVNKNMVPVAEGKNQAEPAEGIGPGNHIYSIVEELCSVSTLIKKEIVSDNPGFTKVLKITPHLLIKPDGYNPVKGTEAYDVLFFIDYEEKVVVHNMPDQLNKIRNSRKMVEDMFANGHVNKKYEYLFTGRNDQILDFNISLDAELTKIFSTPDDIWAYEHFKKEGNQSIILDEHHQELVDKAKNNFEKSNNEYLKHQTRADSLKKELTNLEDDYRNKIITELSNQRGGLSPMGIERAFGDKSLEQLMNEYSVVDEVQETKKGGLVNGSPGAKPRTITTTTTMIGELNITHMKSNLSKKEKAVNEAQEKAKKYEGVALRKEKFAQDEYSNAIASKLNTNNLNFQEVGSKVFTDIRDINPDGKNLILAEELGEDLINRLSNSDYEIILKAQANNPVTFRRLIQGMESDSKPVAISQGDETEIELAREKYYEAKGGKLSMIYADMTIKGDPFWLEGYIPPAKEKEVFGDKGSDLKWNIHSKLNGFPYLVLKSGVAKGVDENENIKTRTLVFSLYAVRSITSNFTNGMFTQNLSMVKWTEAEQFTSEAAEKVGMVEVEGNTNSPGHPSNQGGVPIVDTEVKSNYTGPTYTGSDGVERDGFGRDINGYYYVEGPGKMEPIEVTQERMQNAIAAEGTLLEWLDEHIVVPSKEYLVKRSDEAEAKELDALNNKSESIKNNLNKIDTPVINFVNDALIRQAEAAHYLSDYKRAKKSCNSGNQSYCDQIKNSQNDILAPFGLTTNDVGKLGTATTINNAINTSIAGGAVVTAHEVAMWQHTAGISLNITGHDPADIERKVRELTNERTPTYQFSSLPMGASLDNAVLNEEVLLNTEETEDVVINGTPDTWDEKKAYDDQIRYPNSNNDWKNTFWFKKQVDEIVDESCPEKKFNPKTRRLECTGIKEGTLIPDEVSAINSKAGELNTILQNTELSAEDIERQQTWTSDAFEMLNTKLNKKDLIIGNTENKAMKFALKDTINSSVVVDSLTDDEYQKAAGLVEDINAINSSATDGSHRSDLTTAAYVGQLQHELETLSADATTSSTNLNSYYFDNAYRDVEVKNLQELELQMAIKDLTLPAETMTGVATIVNSGTPTYIPIKNPVDQIEVDQAPILVKTGINTADIILPGSLKSRYSKNYAGEGIGWAYAMQNPDKVSQYNEAKKIYKILVSSDIGDMTTVTDDLGKDFKVKDFSNIAPITYTDANGVSQTISNPSAYFGIHTTTYNDINPSYASDYNVLMGKVADLFPDIISGQKSQLINGKLPKDNDGSLMLTLTGDKFYIDK